MRDLIDKLLLVPTGFVVHMCLFVFVRLVVHLVVAAHLVAARLVVRLVAVRLVIRLVAARLVRPVELCVHV